MTDELLKWMKGGTHRQMLFWNLTTDGQTDEREGLSEMDYLQISHATSGTHSSKQTKWFMNKEQLEKKERETE